MELLRLWGIAFAPDFNRKEIIAYLDNCSPVPYPERLTVVHFANFIMAGYGFLPVTHPIDQSNVAALELCGASWYQERLNRE